MSINDAPVGLGTEFVWVPDCPNFDCPQHLSLPEAKSAQVVSLPALMEIAVEMPRTLTGLERVFVELSPSWPKSF